MKILFTTNIDPSALVPCSEAEWGCVREEIEHRERTPGYHLSGVLKGIGVRCGLMDKVWAEEDCDGWEDLTDHLNFEMRLEMAMGLAWEDWYARCLLKQGLIYHMGELERDGVYMSPDGWTSALRWPDGVRRPTLEEFKTTKRSARRPVFENWYWMNQMMGYCGAMRTVWARLHVIYLNGIYEKARLGRMLGKVYWVEFQVVELRDMWEMVRREVEVSGRLRQGEQEQERRGRRGRVK